MQNSHTYFISGLANGNRGANLGSTTTVHDTVVLNQVSHNTDGIVQSTLGFVDDLTYQLQVVT